MSDFQTLATINGPYGLIYIIDLIERPQRDPLYIVHAGYDRATAEPACTHEGANAPGPAAVPARPRQRPSGWRRVRPAAQAARTAEEARALAGWAEPLVPVNASEEQPPTTVIEVRP